MAAKILMLDIETAPAKVYSWGLYDQNIPINHVIEAGHIICWCAKWLDSKKVMHCSYDRNDKKHYRQMLQGIWALVDEADIVVTHNGNFFDLRWLNAVFLEHGLPPPSPFKSVDTKVELQKNFYELSNKLDYIGRKLDLGAKMNTGGFGLWEGCMRFERKHLDKMVTYCKNDVLLLEKLYLKLRPFMKNHPNLNLYDDNEGCTNCHSKLLVKNGHAYTSTGVYPRYRCQSCGKNLRDKKALIKNKSVRIVGA